MLVLDEVSPVLRVRLSSQLAKRTQSLLAASVPLEKVKLAREIRELLAQLAGSGQSAPASYSLEIDPSDTEGARAAVRGYLEAGLPGIPEALAPYEAMAVQGLAHALGDAALASEAREAALSVIGSRAEEAHLAAFEAVAARGIDPGIDRDSTLEKVGQLEALTKSSFYDLPEYQEVQRELDTLSREYELQWNELYIDLRKAKEAGDQQTHEIAKRALDAAFEQYKKEHEQLYGRLNSIASRFDKEKAAKTADLLTEEGKAVIQSVMDASPINERDAASWAELQPIDKNAADKLRRLGYPIEDLRRDMADFYRLTGGKLPAIRISIDGGRRANATGITGRVGEKIINLGSHFNRTVLFHELAHHLENDPIAKAAANGYLMKRRESSKVYRLRDLTGNKGYSPKEVAYKDDFLSPYIGKVYSDGVTEVFSMGVQYLAKPSDAAVLAAKDPELFALISGYLTSPLSPAMQAKAKVQSGYISHLQDAREAAKRDFGKAVAALAAKVTLVKGDQWERLAVTGPDWRRGIERALNFMNRHGQPVEFVGAHENYFVFAGTYRNINTNRAARGYLVIDAHKADGFYSDLVAVHSGLEMAKAVIALALEKGLGLRVIGREFLKTRPGEPVNVKFVDAARAVAGGSL